MSLFEPCCNLWACDRPKETKNNTSPGFPWTHSVARLSLCYGSLCASLLNAGMTDVFSHTQFESSLPQGNLFLSSVLHTLEPVTDGFWPALELLFLLSWYKELGLFLMDLIFSATIFFLAPNFTDIFFWGNRKPVQTWLFCCLVKILTINHAKSNQK